MYRILKVLCCIFFISAHANDVKADYFSLSKSAQQGDEDAKAELIDKFYSALIPASRLKSHVDLLDEYSAKGNAKAKILKYFTIVSDVIYDKDFVSNLYKQIAIYLESPSNAEEWYWSGRIKLAEGNYQTAAQCFQKASEQGNHAALYYLGLAYQSGRGVPHDMGKAMVLIHKAAANNVPQAQYALAGAYHFGDGVKKNFQAAKRLYQNSAAAGHASALYMLVSMNDGKKKQDWKKVFAETATIEDILSIAIGYDDGSAFQKSNLDEAIYWYTIAASRGSNKAATRLATLYIYNKNYKNLKRGLELLNKAANKNYGPAFGELGYYYAKEAEPKDYKKSIEYLKKGIALEDASSYFGYGVLLEKGLGIAKDYKKAAEFYEKSTELGNIYAANNLGFMYYNGRLGERDLKKAEEFFVLAASKGVPEGIQNLKHLYMHSESSSNKSQYNTSKDEELEILEEKLSALDISTESKQSLQKDIDNQKNRNPSEESAIEKRRLEFILDLPWNKYKAINTDLKAARKILDQDQYGMKPIKDKIIEYLAVQKRLGRSSGQVLLLSGPPGVGKTAIAKSIAKATGRDFQRIALGGINDERAIRGFEKAYIGSTPGAIIKAIKVAGSANPVILLDEIDKMGENKFSGDPSAALLEVLDPEQNQKFIDHFVDLPFDLSNVLFIATSNSNDISAPLMDRMDMIQLSGYLESEKLQIAKNFLLPKERKLNGLKTNELSIDDAAMKKLITGYTQEAGVRALSREIANIARKALVEIETGEAKAVSITIKNLEKYAGVEKLRMDPTNLSPKVGVTNILAYTSVGGIVMTNEAVIFPGSGSLVVTGQIKDVMKESIRAALTFVRSRASHFGIVPSMFVENDLHIHVSNASIPKSGPSAGAAMIVSIISAFTGIPVRGDVAMTGEINLRGQVMAIGGLREKLVAAHRAGMKRVIIPFDNKQDLSEVPDTVKSGMEIITVKNIDEALAASMVKKTTPLTKGK